MAKTGHKNKGKNSNYKPAKDQYSRWESAGLAVAAFLAATVVGVICYDFWVKWLSPVWTIVVVTAIPFLGMLLDKLGIKPFTSLENKSKQFKYNTLGICVGLCIGIALAVVAHTAGIAVVRQPSDDGGATPPVQAVLDAQNKDGAEEGEPEETIVEVGEITAEEDYPEYTSNTTIEVKDPVTVAAVSNEYDESDMFSPAEGEQCFVSLVDETLSGYDIKRTPDEKDTWIALISDCMKTKINLESQPSDEEINGDADFGGLTWEANEIEGDLISNGMDMGKLSRVISLREQAYGIFQTKDLRLLLANSYHSRARQNSSWGNWWGAYLDYIEAIKYELSYIKMLREANGDYYKHLYNIGILYQCIGDIPALQADYKQDAYYLSACYLEIVAKSGGGIKTAEMDFLSNYYAGMINHKLFLLDWNKGSELCNYYLVSAIEYYETSLVFDGYKMQRQYQRGYLRQMCQHALNYISKYGKAENMKSKDEYEERLQRYQSNDMV